MTSGTKSKDGRPSEYVIVYVSRRQAEAIEAFLGTFTMSATKWASGLAALRNALRKNAGKKRYPWQVEKS